MTLCDMAWLRAWTSVMELSLSTCAIAMSTTITERTWFHVIHSRTGNRVSRGGFQPGSGQAASDHCTQVQVALQRGAEPHRRTKGADRGKVIRNPEAFGRSPSPEKAQGSCFLEASASCSALEQAAAIAVSCRNAWKLRPGYRQTRMGKWAAALLLATLIAGLFGFGGTGGPATAIAQTAFFVLLVPSVLSLMLTAMTLD